MNPIHKEKYILSKETYGYVTIDQNKPQLDKNKAMMKLTAWIQIIVGAVFIASSIILKQTNMFVFSIFAVVLIIVGIHGLKTKGKKYEKQIWENIEKSYNGREYGENWFEVKFFEDHLKYLVGGSIDQLHYNDFNQFFESEHYFCAHFNTGDLLIFNPDCNKEKIREIIFGYRKKGEESETLAEAAYEAAEDAIEAKFEAAENAVEAKIEAIEEKAEAFADKVEAKIEEIIED